MDGMVTEQRGGAYKATWGKMLFKLIVIRITIAILQCGKYFHLSSALRYMTY